MTFFRFNKNLGYVFITLMCLLFIGASYFFVYIPNNEKAVEEQRFRILQNIVTNLQAKIDNSQSLLENLLSGTDPSQLKEEIEHQNASGLFTIRSDSTGQRGIAPAADSTLTMKINNAAEQVSIYAARTNQVKAAANAVSRLSMTFNVEQFIKPLLPADIFDEYIVFNHGFALYESFPSGIYNAITDSLLTAKNGVGGSRLRNITLSGKAYKLFLQPVHLGTDHDLVIAGLLTNYRYQQERTKLPPQAVMFLVTLVIIMIITFPWIKLYQMGNKDRLTIADGAASVVVSMLLMSMLFFVFFKYNSVFRPKKNPNNLNHLSQKMISRFKNEIDSSYKLLYTFNALQTQSGLPGNVTNLDKDSIAYNGEGSGIPGLNKLAAKASIKQVFWLDQTGMETTNWTTGNKNPIRGDFSKRAYFSKIVNGQEYHLNNDPAKAFYLDQIVSWTSGVFTSVISIPSAGYANRNEGVTAMSFNLTCFRNTVLPTGFVYALTDGNGRVLYHSDASRNLNENLLTEFSEGNVLRSLFQAHTEGYFTTDYYSRNYLVKSTPVTGLPYFFVLMEDSVYKQTRDVEVYSFTFSMLLLLFSFLVLQLIVTFVVSARRSFFKKQLFDTSWIGPKISFNKEYVICALANVAMLVLLCCFFHVTTFLQYLFILLFSFSFIVLFLNILLARRYLLQNKKNNFKFKRIALCWLAILIVGINVAAFISLDAGHRGIFVLFELLSFAAGALLFVFTERLVESGRKINQTLNGRWTYVHSFTLMVLTRLVITSGLPVAFFYITAYNFEQNISTRYKLLDYSDRLLEQRDIPTGTNTIRRRWLNDPAVYTDGVWVHGDPAVVSKPIPRQASWPSHEEALTCELLRRFRLAIGEQATRVSYLHNEQPTDTSIIFNHEPVSTHETNGIQMTRQMNRNGQFLQLGSYNINYHMPTPFSRNFFLPGLLFWLSLLIMLVIFFAVLHNIIKKLFALNLPDLKIWKTLDDKIIMDPRLNRLLFIIGLPGAGKLEYLRTKIKNGDITFSDNEKLVWDQQHPENSNVFVADLVNIPDSTGNNRNNADWSMFMDKVLHKKNRLIIVNHFEYNIQDEATNHTKLNFLEKLMQENKCKIIVLSAIHPVAFLDSVNDGTFKTKDGSASGHDLERWHVLLGHYRIAIIPLPVMQEQETQESWKQLISRETRYTHFLHAMQQTTLDIARNLPQEQAIAQRDELAFKLQVTAHYFYMYIWQSLTKEEKYLLYDLAEDNLVNSYDDYNLSLLIGKGLLVYSDGTLQLFNKGFRNFILTAIGNMEAMKIQQQIKDNGNWSKLRTPLLITIFAILAFLLISQQEAYSRLITYLAALSAGVPVVLKLFGVFDKNVQKSGS